MAPSQTPTYARFWAGGQRRLAAGAGDAWLRWPGAADPRAGGPRCSLWRFRIKLAAALRSADVQVHADQGRGPPALASGRTSRCCSARSPRCGEPENCPEGPRCCSSCLPALFAAGPLLGLQRSWHQVGPNPAAFRTLLRCRSRAARRATEVPPPVPGATSPTGAASDFPQRPRQPPHPS